MSGSQQKMRIEIQRASNLGAIYRKLSIDPESRISFSGIGADGRFEIWDLVTGNYFAVSAFTDPPSIDVTQVPIPQWLRRIIESSTDDLMAEYRSTWQEGASEKRMAIFTELNFRGVSVL
jgi:WD40 repeat protein